MDWLLSIVSLVGGVYLLLKAGDHLVKHAAQLATAYRVPKTVVGAVILGFGTSCPELFVSVDAAFRNSPGIALGNVLGSNIANVGLVLGIAAFLSTVHVERNVLRADLPLGVLAALFLMLWVGPRGEVSAVTGCMLLAAFAGYLWLSLRHTHQYRLEQAGEEPGERRLGRHLAWLVAGLLGVGLGAHLLVHGAREIAGLIGVSERVIGLSVVAVGTSLPELAATLAAARRGETDLAVGNIAGSNLFNLLFVLGTTAVLMPEPIAVEKLVVERDFPIVAAFSVLAFPLLARARRIRRMQGLVMLAAYLGYVLWTWA